MIGQERYSRELVFVHRYTTHTIHFLKQARRYLRI